MPDDNVDTTPDAPVAALEPEPPAELDDEPADEPRPIARPAVPPTPVGPPRAPRPPMTTQAIDAARQRFLELREELRQPRVAAQLLREYLSLRLRLHRRR